MKQNKIITLLALALMAFASCEKDPTPDTPITPADQHKAYVLSEGNWGGNNSSLGLLTDNGIDNEWFSTNNGRGLGELAQDAIHYGSRIYVVVSGSQKLEVVNAATGKSVKQIDFGQKSPRYILAHEGKLYVTSYDKTVVRIDTTALEIEATCQLSGLQPEQLCLIGNNLYVCNTWENDANGIAHYDNTVSVVDLGTFTETGKLTVGCNPGHIQALDDHRFIVACGGDYDATPAQTLIYDINTHNTQVMTFAASNFARHDNKLYLYSTAYNADWSTTTNFYVMDITSGTVTPILTNFSDALANAYSINVNPADGNIYVSNSVYGANSDLYIFSPQGEKLAQYEAGIFTNKVVF